MDRKYFNFVTPESAGYVVYGADAVLARVFHRGLRYGVLTSVDPRSILHDPRRLSVHMGHASIMEQGGWYHLAGTQPGVTWSLRYEPTTAKVSGTLDLPHVSLAVEGVGHMDATWGAEPPLDGHYERGQFKDRNLSLVWEFEKSMRVALAGHYLTLENPTFLAEHHEWTQDKELGLSIPAYSTFHVQDKRYMISFSTKLKQADHVALAAASLAGTPVISQELVQYSGIIRRRGYILKKFEGLGFQEYSTRTSGKFSVTL